MAMNGEVLPRQEAILGHCASEQMTPSIPVPKLCSLLQLTKSWNGARRRDPTLCVEALSHGGSLDFRHYLK